MAGKNKLKSVQSTAKTDTKSKATKGEAVSKKFWEDRRFLKIAGLALFALSIYCFIAFTSFFFTWKADQSMLSDSWWSVFRDGNYDAENWLGPLGAMVGHVFIYQWFGVVSCLFIFLFFNFGFRILFGKALLPIWSSSFKCLMAMVVFSPILSFVFYWPDAQIIGGAFGYELNYILKGKIGLAGTGILLLFSGLSYIIIVFNPSFAWVQPILEKSSGLIGSLFNSAKNKVKDSRAYLDSDEDEDDEKKFHDTIAEKDQFKTAAQLALEDEELDENPFADDEDEFRPAPTPIAVVKRNTLDLEIEIAEEPESEKEEELEVAPAIVDKELTDAELEKKVKDFGEYDPTLDLADFKMPPVDLLHDYGGGKIVVTKEELEENKNKIVTTLSHYKIGIEKIKATIGPTVTLYEIVPEPGVRISRIKSLEDDIALSLAALGIRIIAPIPGKGTIGIEVPNSTPDIVSMRSLIASEKFQNSTFDLPIALGKTISNETYIADLTKMPHLLMAGATGQGKSVGLNAILVSLLYKRHPSQIKFVLVDPKKVELTLFNKIERHYLAKLPDEEEAIITDTSKVVKTLNSLCIEMDNRYEMLKNAGVRNIKEYNTKFINRRLNPEKGHKFLPYIVLVVDEFADLIMTAGKEVETPIARLAQLARAIGIHLIIATQRPSVNIITGVIKANFPARIAFRVSSKIDSRTILDASGADQLIGRGDMLLSTGNDLIRIQCGFVDTPEVDEITEYIGNQRGYASALNLPEVETEDGGGLSEIDLGDRDPLFEDAARVIVINQQGSTSLIQRKLKLGYNRAGRIVDQLEAAGIVGPFEGSKARQVLISDEYALEQFLKREAQNIEN